MAMSVRERSTNRHPQSSAANESLFGMLVGSADISLLGGLPDACLAADLRPGGFPA
jgi:hypothetical protein